MSSKVCDKCGLAMDLCVCKEEEQEQERLAIAEGKLKRCGICNGLFKPRNDDDVLCEKCRSEPVVEEAVHGKPEVEAQKVEVGEPDPVPKNVEVTVKANDQPATFSAIPEGLPVVEKKTEIPVPQEVIVKIKDACEKANEDAELIDFVKNPAIQTVTLKGIIKDSGKPIELILSDDYVQRLVRELLPDERKRQQELLDKMHGIRKTRGLSVEAIDKQLTALMQEAEKRFDACKTGTDVKKVEGMFRAKLAVLTQKRYLAKFSIQEESELSLQLAKLQHGEE